MNDTTPAERPGPGGFALPDRLADAYADLFLSWHRELTRQEQDQSPHDGNSADRDTTSEDQRP